MTLIGGLVFAVAIFFSTVSFNFARCASSRLISSSMRFEKRYLRIHFPWLTFKSCQRLRTHYGIEEEVSLLL